MFCEHILQVYKLLPKQTAFHVVEKVACVYYYLGEQLQRILLHEMLDIVTTSLLKCLISF